MLKEYFFSLHKILILISLLTLFFFKEIKITKYIFLSLFLLNFIIFFITKFILIYRKFKTIIKFSNKTYNVFTNNKETEIFTEKSIFEISFGDIIKLEKDDIVPREMMIISGSSGSCFKENILVDKRLLESKLLIERKNSIKKIKPQPELITDYEFKRYLQSLTFTLKYKKNKSIKNFEGILKFKKDPKPEEIKIDKILEKDLIIRSRWILGIVLFEENFYQTFFKNLEKKNKLDSIIGKYYIVIQILFLVLFWIFFIFTQTLYNLQFSILRNFLIALFCNIPLNLEIIILILNHYISSKFELKTLPFVMKKKKKFSIIDIGQNNFEDFKNLKSMNFIKQPQSFTSKTFNLKKIYKIVNPNIITNLGNLGTVAFTKNDFLTQKKIEIKSIYYKDTYYSIDYIKKSDSFEIDRFEMESMEDLMIKKKKEKIDRRTPKKKLDSQIIINQNLSEHVKKSSFKLNKKNNFFANVFEEKENEKNLLESKTKKELIKLKMPVDLKKGEEVTENKNLKKKENSSSNPKNERTPLKNPKKKEEKTEGKINFFLKYKKQNKSNKNQELFLQKKKNLNTISLKIKKESSNDFLIEKIPDLKDILMDFIPNDPSFLYSTSKLSNIHSYSYKDQAFIDFKKKFNCHISNVRYINTVSGFSIVNKGFGIKNKINVFIVPVKNEESFLKFYLVGNKNVTLFVKLHKISDIPSFLKDKGDLFHLRKVVKKNEDNNLETIIFLKKELNLKDSTFLQNHLKNLKKKSQNPIQFFESACSTNWKTMNLYATFGLKEEVEKKTQLIDNLIEAKIRIVYLSQDNFNNTSNALQPLNIFSSSKNFFKISFTSEKKGIIIFKEFYKKHQIYFEELNTLKKTKANFKTENLFKHQKFIIFINNVSIKTILDSPYLFYNLKFLFKFSKSIIGYNFTRENNGLIIDLLKEINPNLSTMAIGSFNKDIDMIKKADIGIQYFHNESYKLFGDIAINDLNYLSDLIFLHSQNYYRNLYLFVYFVFFNCVFLVIEIFFYSVTSFNSFVIFPNICLLIEKDFIFYLIGFFIIFNKKEILNKSVNDFKIFYQRFNFYQKNQNYLILLDFIEAFILAVFIFFFNYFLFFLTNFDSQFFIVYFLIINHMAILTRSFILYNYKNILYWIFLVFSFVLFIVFIILNCYLETEFLNIDKFYGFLQNKFFYLFLIPNFIFIFSFSYCINYFFRMKKLEVLSKLVNDKSTDLIMIKFLKYFFYNIKNIYLSKIIYSVFKLKECIEPLLLNTISPLDQLSKKNQINKFLLTFKKKFIRNSYNMNNKYDLKKKKIIFLVYFLFICSLIILGIIDDEKIYTNFISVGFSFCGFLIFLIFNHLKLHLRNFISFLLCIILFVITISFWNNFKVYIIMNTFFLFFLLDFENLGFPFFMIIFTLITLINIPILNNEFLKKDSKIDFFIMFLFLIISNISIIIIYIRKKIILKKKIFLMKSRLKHKKNYNNELLTFLMPKFVLNKISYDVSEVNLADDAGYATVIFADICNFDKLIKNYGNDIVSKLDSIYKDFDSMCEKYGGQKIETVGKTYMAVCGLEIVEENLSDTLKSIETSKRALDLAMSLNNIISNYKDYNGKPINLKIGIHSGKLMMGVIGYHKPQFSLIGDTVNTTSRLCCTGEKSHIMMSNEFFEQIKEFEFDKEIVFEKRLTFMKGKGDVPVYHLFKKENKFRNMLFQAISNKSSLSNSRIIKENSDYNKLTKLKKYKEKKTGINQMFHLLKRFGKNNFFKLFQNHNLVSDVKIENKKINDPKEYKSKKTRIKGSIDSYNSISLEVANNDVKKPSNKQIDLIEEFVFQKIIQKGYPYFEIEKNPFNFKFKNYYDLNFLYKNQIICFIIIAISIIQLIHIFFHEFFISYHYKILFIEKAIIIILFIIVSSLGKYFFKVKYSFLLKIIFILILLTINIQYTFLKSDFLKFKFFLLSEELSIFTFMSFSNLISIKSFYIIFIINFLIKVLAITFANFLIKEDQENLINNIYILLSCFFIEICLFINKINFSRLKIDYFNNLYLEKQKNTQINDFINRLMPEHIQKILKNPKSKLAEEYKNVSMIFADIVGFTSYSAGKKPKEVVLMLSKLFTDFDKECNLLKVFKVYTIGDCYVALGFVDKYNRLPIHEEAYKIVQFGFKMIEIIEKVKKEIKYEGLNMRIGIHTGNIIGGVIGSDIIRFDIYGENVLIANKMESKGIKGRINISHYTKQILENNYEEFLFEDHGTLKVGKKEIKMHLIESFDK